jgi:AcrR family transcriptional regulator
MFHLTGRSVNITAMVGRTFRGQTAAERAAARRARLLEAALDLIGAEGWPAATMTAICRRAGLTERYFYESFPDREALYLTLLDALAAEVDGAVRAALDAGGPPEVRLRRTAYALVGVLVADPRKGRAALLEGLGSERLQQRRREVLATFERFVLDEAATVFGAAAPSREHTHLAAVGLVGAVQELLVRRLDGSLPAGDDALVAHVVRLALASAHPQAAGGPAAPRPPD